MRSIGASASVRAISTSFAATPSAGPGAMAASNRARSDGAAASSSPAGSASPGIGSRCGRRWRRERSFRRGRSSLTTFPGPGPARSAAPPSDEDRDPGGQRDGDADQERHDQTPRRPDPPVASIGRGSRRPPAPRQAREATPAVCRRRLRVTGVLHLRMHLFGFLVPASLRRRLDLIIWKVCSVQRRPPDGCAVISSLAIWPGGARRLVGHGASVVRRLTTTAAQL